MIFRRQHLHDDRLFDAYLAQQLSEASDPSVAEHLADCRTCATRYGALVNLMGEIRTDADEATDALFSPERLRAQQQQIARRIEHVGHAARVISFPLHRPAEQQERSSMRLPRFAVATAAAGLFIGVALGASFGWSWHQAPLQLADTQQTPASAPVSPQRDTALPAEINAEDDYLSKLELMLDRPQTAELRVYDAMTPRVRDIAMNVR